MGIVRLNDELQDVASELEREKAKKASNALATSSGGASDSALAEAIKSKDEEIERLESEVEQWMVASEQLQKIGEDAVAEITAEADRLRQELATWQQTAEEQIRRRREAEAELLNSESKLNELDSMVRRLIG